MIPQPMTLAIPAFAVALVAWLRDARLPRIANYAIILVFFGVSVYLCIVLGGGLTGDSGKDAGIIIAECAAVFALLESAMNTVSTVIPSPLGGIAANMAKKVEQQREFEQWQASLKPQVSRASAPPPQQQQPPTDKP
jgi:hypothetical protein